jgi:two-component system sensor histidine kinase AlgZ
MSSQKRPSHTSVYVPDYCNVGVICRVLLTVNAVVFFGILGRGQGWGFNSGEFVETAMLVELISMMSLLILCGLSGLLERYCPHAWILRIICGLVPALVCALVLSYAADIEWFVFSFPRLQYDYSILLSCLFGVVLQYYFELRNRAFSPALGEARLQALQARIRPHFLFNSLNAVLSLIRSEPRRAETVLEDLADLFRVLMRDTRDITTLQEEIHLCEQYLSIEKVRLGERLQVSWNAENLTAKEIRETKIPALLLQPLMENAVHYGVEPSDKSSLILVAIRRRMDKIEITVRNPVHAALGMVHGNHMALENIRQRLALLYDVEADLHYGLVANDFEVKLYFPCKK